MVTYTITGRQWRIDVLVERAQQAADGLGRDFPWSRPILNLMMWLVRRVVAARRAATGGDELTARFSNDGVFMGVHDGRGPTSLTLDEFRRVLTPAEAGELDGLLGAAR